MPQITVPWLIFDLLQVIIQGIKPAFPKLTEGVQPDVELLKWSSLKLVNALLSNLIRNNKPGIAQDPQMLGNLRLMEVKPF